MLIQRGAMEGAAVENAHGFVEDILHGAKSFQLKISLPGKGLGGASEERLQLPAAQGLIAKWRMEAQPCGMLIHGKVAVGSRDDHYAAGAGDSQKLGCRC